VRDVEGEYQLTDCRKNAVLYSNLDFCNALVLGACCKTWVKYPRKLYVSVVGLSIILLSQVALEFENDLDGGGPLQFRVAPFAKWFLQARCSTHRQTHTHYDILQTKVA